MLRILFFIASLVSAVITPAAVAQVNDYVPVTREMLLDPPPGDWLMFSRTYDNQRFSPLDQINRQNVGQLRMVWARGMGAGIHENIPLVHQGVMYVATPGAVIQALDATNGDLIWEYRRKLPADLSNFIGNAGRARSIAIYEDLVFYAAPDGYLLGLDARTGELRWETRVHDYTTGTQHTTGPIVVEGKLITGRGCSGSRAGCFIAAHDALTGKELWKFYTTPAPGEPGGDSWGSVPVEKRMASPWGLPGAYDPVRKLVYWGIANPKPHTRLKRHGGNIDDIPRSAPADLYSNSTVALDPSTGKLAWYYQHLPGDDWDADHTQERILLRTAFNPDPAAVKWINPLIPRGEERDIAPEDNPNLGFQAVGLSPEIPWYVVHGNHDRMFLGICLAAIEVRPRCRKILIRKRSSSPPRTGLQLRRKGSRSTKPDWRGLSENCRVRRARSNAPQGELPKHGRGRRNCHRPPRILSPRSPRQSRMWKRRAAKSWMLSMRWTTRSRH
ncbi:MAG: PQQ-binding-like beta-propeller repeat protein [Acidobacteria bacterium]|nr:PQQ-binding-like beta-propeller repeat protein [Acidobacteriota bacterium]